VILGYIGPSNGRPPVDAVLEFIDYGNAAIPVTFVIDTGCPRTMLGEEETVVLEQLLGISANRIGAASVTSGIGGFADARNVRCNLTLTRADGVVWSRRVDLQLLLADPDSDLSPCPSLLGTDVLWFLPLYLDFGAKRVELHDELPPDY
jgi:hypothetical protein